MPGSMRRKRRRRRAVIASVAKQSIVPHKGRMDCFVASAPRNDDDGHEPTFSRRDPPEVCLKSLAPIRGRGECRMRAAPAVPCAKKCQKTHTSIQVQRRTSDIPCAMALRLITRSPRRRIRLVTVVGELTAYPRPVGPTRLRQLDTSNGCRNHTTSPYASASFVCAPFDRSRAPAQSRTRPAITFHA
jgi:hypothetical protein